MDKFDSRQLLSSDSLVHALSASLPQERLENLALKNKGSDLSPGELYILNLGVSADLWILFHILEILLRNAVSDQLVKIFSEKDWWDSPELFHNQEGRDIRRASQSSKDRKGSATKGDVIAGLNLGFWTILFSGSYHKYLWEAGLHNAFKGYSGRRKQLYVGLERLRKLRNRIAHHEPILNRDYLFDLKLLIEIIGFIEPEVGSAINQAQQHR